MGKGWKKSAPAQYPAVRNLVTLNTAVWCNIKILNTKGVLAHI